MEMDLIQKNHYTESTDTVCLMIYDAAYYDYYIKLAAGRFLLNYAVTFEGKKKSS